VHTYVILRINTWLELLNIRFSTLTSSFNFQFFSVDFINWKNLERMNEMIEFQIIVTDMIGYCCILNGGKLIQNGAPKLVAFKEMSCSLFC